MSNDGLYLQLFSVHGLVRGSNLEMGRNADTGGQVKYVVELARALGRIEGVRKVDLFTRLIRGKEYSSDYGQKTEELAENVRIVRIQCGGTRYIRKELLWPHLDEFVDKTLKFIKDSGDMPDLLHGHYADAGYIVKELAAFLGTPFVFTGHSLGRPKRHKLSESGMSDEDMNRKFNIDTRIAVEEEVLQRATFVVASTSQEVEDQYGMYDNHASGTFHVLPPGTDTVRFHPFYEDPQGSPEEIENVKQAQFYMNKELQRFLSDPEKPLILALSRPDKRKNIPGLVTAYGQDKELQAIANLAVFAGLRRDINDMDDNEREVLTELLLLMDKFDLYGKLAIPKRHDFEYEVPELYRIAARTQGVFVNPAYTEPFGLTLIESAASGLPIVSTDDGGPRDIIANCKNGALVNVSNTAEISAAIKEILIDPDRWRTLSRNGIQGVKDHYAWEAHGSNYLEKVRELPREPQARGDGDGERKRNPIGRRLAGLRRMFITDIDDTLLGDDAAVAEIGKLLREHWDRLAFGVATGRPREAALAIFKEHNLPEPDLVISSVGTEIYYGGQDLLPDHGWRSHIAAEWKPDRIVELLEPLDFLFPQEEDWRREYKISYFMEADVDRLARVHQVLTENRIRYTLIYSRGQFLDILPFRASKGKAIRYVSYKWNIPLGNILVSGDSDNDQDMLRGEMLGVVVGNHHPDLDKLRGLRHIYFAEAHHARGIMEGFEHYRFLKR